MKVKFFAIILLSMFLLKIVADSSYELSKDEKIVNAITSQTMKKIKQKTGLSPCGTGGRMMYDVELLRIAFQCYETLTIEKARELLVYCVDEYLSEINSNEEVRQYLANYPFTVKNVEIEIWCSKPDGTDVELGDIVLAKMVKGKMICKVYKSKDSFLTVLHEETYEQAAKSVRK